MDTQLLRKIENSKFFDIAVSMINEKTETEIIKYFEINFNENEISKLNQIEILIKKLINLKYFDVLNYLFETKLNFREFNYLKIESLKSEGKIAEYISLLETEIAWAIQNNYYQYYLKNIKQYNESSANKDLKDIFQIWYFAREEKANELIKVIKFIKEKNISKNTEIIKNIVKTLNSPNQTKEDIIISGILNYKIGNIDYEVLLSLILSINTSFESVFHDPSKKKINGIIVRDEEILKMELAKFKNNLEKAVKKTKSHTNFYIREEKSTRFKDLKQNLLFDIAYNEIEIKNIVKNELTTQNELMDLVGWMLKNKKYTEILLVLNELPKEKKEYFKEVEWELVQRINEKN